MELGKEQKHLHKQSQTLLIRQAEEAQAEQGEHGEGEEWRIQRQLVQYSAGKLKMEVLTTTQELHRDGEGRIEHSLGDEEPRVLFGNRLEAKEDQRQVQEPIKSSQSSTEGGLQRSVKTFNHATEGGNRW